MGRVGLRWAISRGGSRLRTYAGTEGIVKTRSGGCRGRRSSVREDCGGGVGGDEAHRLRRRELALAAEDKEVWAVVAYHFDVSQ